MRFATDCGSTLRVEYWTNDHDRGRKSGHCDKCIINYLEKLKNKFQDKWEDYWE
jgi:hypothetical protein